MSLGRGVSVASVASGAVLATAGTHRGAAPQLGNSILGGGPGGLEAPRALFSFILGFILALYTSARGYLSVYRTQSTQSPTTK